MLKGTLLVACGNCALLLAKVIIWLVIPGILGVTEYGYYKTYTLYLVYAMFLHFGFPDGILLLYAGKKYEEIDKEEFRAYSKFLLVFMGSISVIGFLICFIFFDGMDQFIYCMLCIDSFFMNYATYFKFVSQSVMRFKEFTIRNLVDAGLKLGCVFLMVFLTEKELMETNAKTYILSLVLVDAIILFWYIKNYWDIIYGKANPINWKKILHIFRIGILLTVAAQVSSLIFNLDRQLVVLMFDINTYSLYSFAYSVINMVTVAIGAVSTVLFPSIKRLDINNAMEKYTSFMWKISAVVFFLIAGYYPLIYFINWILPEYADSLVYIKIIFPGLALSCCINMVIFTYYKALRELKRYLNISIMVLIIGLFLNIIGYYFWQSPMIFSIASIITMLIWYLVSESYLVHEFHIKWVGNLIYIVILMIWFYCISVFITNSYVGFILYFIGYVLITLIAYKLKKAIV